MTEFRIPATPDLIHVYGFVKGQERLANSMTALGIYNDAKEAEILMLVSDVKTRFGLMLRLPAARAGHDETGANNVRYDPDAEEFVLSHVEGGTMHEMKVPG